MDNEQVRELLADLAKDDPRPRLAGVLEIRAANYLREHGARLLADSEAYAKLRARIARAPVGTVVYCDLEHYERPAWHVVDDRYSVTLNEPKRVALLPVGEGE